MLKARASALPAIAAAMALSSTPLFAQEVQPADPAPVTTDTPAPTTDPAPATTDTVTAPDPLAAEAATPSAKTTVTKTVKSSTRAVPKSTAARPVTTKMVTTASATAPIRTAPVREPAPTVEGSAVAPVVDVSTPPPAKPVAQAQPTSQNNNTELALGGGALALIALGGAAFAMSRRRRNEDEWVEEPAVVEQSVVSDEPVMSSEQTPRHDSIVHDEQPAIVAPSAFTWGRPQQPVAESDGRDPIDDRLPGESWIERAYRGPSPSNPSASLKNRLRRAAFFDKREREVAAGTAEPIDIDAGLPPAAVEESERELA